MKCIWIVIKWLCSPEQIDRLHFLRTKPTTEERLIQDQLFPYLEVQQRRELIKWTEKENHFKEREKKMRRVFFQEKQEQGTSKVVKEMNYKNNHRQLVPLRSALMEEKNMKEKSRQLF